MLHWIFIAALLTWSSVSTLSTDYCPKSIAHDRFNQVLNDRCYRFEFGIDLEYSRAESYCRQRGGHLAMPKTRQINDFLGHHLVHTYKYHKTVWIGLNDIDDERNFKFADGSPLGKFNSWANSGEGPRGWTHIAQEVEDCVGMNGGKWYDYRCYDFFFHVINEHKCFICEFPVVPHKATTESYETKTDIVVHPVTAQSTRSTTEKCPRLVCTMDCGMSGYAMDSNGCLKCECDE